MKTANKVLAVAIAGALVAPVAFAQEEEPAAAGQLGEILVTAQKREESAQKTPISMGVYTAEDIVAAGIHDLQSLVGVDPSINLTVTNGAGYVAMRGIASTDVTEIGDPSVAISRDGFFTNRSYSLFASMYDVQRIEVLKGPQGTLYGRNSTGGVVNILSHRPDPKFGGYVAADVGDFNALNFEAALNVPMGDKVQLRASGVSRQHDAYRDNSPAPVDGDDEDSYSGRLQLAFQPFEGFNGWIAAQYDRVDNVGDVAAKGPFGVVDAVPDSTTFPVYTETLTDLTDKRLRWEFSYDGLPAGMSITYLGGYDDTSWKHALDATPMTATPLQQFLQEENPTTWNHELRLASAADARLFWQVGLFYFKEDNSPLNSGLFIESGPFADRYLIQFHYDVATTSKAAFGQMAYQINDQWRVSAGARYTEDEKTRSGEAILDLQVASGGALPPILITTPGDGHMTDSQPTYHVGVDWSPTPSNLIYAKYDTGFKSGGFNSNGSAPSVPYGPETVDAVELGTKNRFAGEQLQLNAALFWQKYDGYQASQFTPALGGGPGVQNAGDARIKGIEAELIYASAPVGRFNLTATWLDTEFKDFTAVSPDGSQTLDLSGNELPNAPEFSLSGGFEHAFQIGPGALTARIDGKYTSTFNYSFYNFPDTESPSTTTGNVSVGYAPDSGSWNLLAYCRNFTDEVVLVQARHNVVVNPNFNEYQFAPPRTYGVRFQYNF